MSEEQKISYIELANKRKEEIVNYLKRRGVKYLVHFTPIDNVESILKYGILPRESLDKQGIKYVCTDNERFDNKKDYSNCSISFPNYKMMYLKKNSFRFAIFLIDIEVLKEFCGSSVYFVPHNAAIRGLNLDDHYIGLDALKEMFSEQIRYNNCYQVDESMIIPNYYTSDPQAEVLILENIPTKYIKEVVVQDENYLKTKLICDKINIGIEVKNALYSPYDKYFFPRKDWKCWSKQ